MKAEKVVEVESKIKNRPAEKAETVCTPEVVPNVQVSKPGVADSLEECVDLISKAGLTEELVKLHSVEEGIKAASEDIKEQYLSIGVRLNAVKDLKIYSYLGYPDFYGYAESVFGFKKSFVSNLINISEKYNPDQIKGASVSVLCELLPIAEDQEVVKLLKDSTVKDIRKFKKAFVIDETFTKTMITKCSEFAKAIEDEISKIPEVSFTRGATKVEEVYSFQVYIPVELEFKNLLEDITSCRFSFNARAEVSRQKNKPEYSCCYNCEFTKEYKKLCNKMDRSIYHYNSGFYSKDDLHAAAKEVTKSVMALLADVKKYKKEQEKQQKAKFELAETLAKETGKTPEEILKEEEEAKKQLTKKPKSPHGLTNNEKRIQFVRDWNNWTKCEFKSNDVPFEIYRFNVSEVGKYYGLKTLTSDWAMCYYCFEEKRFCNSSTADIAAKLAEVNY